MSGQVADMRAEAVIGRIAARQGGVVGRKQLRAAGLSPDVIDRRVRSGLLKLLHRGVYVVGYRALTRESQWWAAVLAMGPTAAVGHADAAAVWRFGRATSGPVSVTVPGIAGRARRRGIILHRSPLPPGDVVVRSGLRVTSPARTLLDLAAVLSARDLERIADEAHYLNRMSPQALSETLDRNRNRPGAYALRRLLATHELGSTRTETELEEAFLRAVRAAGIPLPRSQTWIGRHRVDFLWPAQRLVVEVDGERSHRGKRRQARDAQRDTELAGKGYEILRVDEEELRFQPTAAAARVSRGLSGLINRQPARSANSASADSVPSGTNPSRA